MSTQESQKHTPGPWKVRFLRDNEPERGFFVEAANNNKPELGYGIEILGEDFGEHNGYPLEQRLADAYLIASAPLLREENEKLKTLLEEERRIKKANEGAINSMLGKSLEEREALVKRVAELEGRVESLQSENKRLREALNNIENIELEVVYDSRDASYINSRNQGISQCQEIATAALKPLSNET